MEDSIKNIAVPIVRHLLGAVGGYYGISGLATDSTIELLAGAAAALVALGWSIMEKKNAKAVS